MCWGMIYSNKVKPQASAHKLASDWTAIESRYGKNGSLEPFVFK
jgi:hypothetical protein